MFNKPEGALVKHNLTFHVCESGSGDLFDDEGFLAGLGRKLIKCTKTGSKSNQSKTGLMAQMAQNGSERLKNGRGRRGLDSS